MKKTLYFLLLLVIVITSCRKDIESEKTEIIILVGEDVETNLHGTVISQDGNAISEAEVSVGGNTTFTDSDGYFYLPNLIVPEDGFALEINSSSHVKSVRRIIPQSKTNTYEEVVLLSQPTPQLFESGSTNLHDNGFATITINANSLVDENNNPYNGRYSCEITYYNPSNIETLRTMPGNLEGITKNGEKVTLGSLGMLYINVQSENGEELFLTENQVAQVELRAPVEIYNNAPADLLIWSLDETTSLWLEENVELEIDVIGELPIFRFGVTEFTFWNCDVPFENTLLTGTITSDIGYPLENRLVQITFEDNGINYFSIGGNTNNKGEYKARVPKNKVVELNIYDQNCNDLLFLEEIGPFSDDEISADFIATTANNTSVVIGEVYSCNNQPIGNATVILKDFNNKVKSSTQTNQDGTFSIHDLCTEDLFSLKVIDLDNMTNMTTDLFQYSEIETNVDQINTCQNQDSLFLSVSSSALELLSFSIPIISLSGNTLIINAENNIGEFSLEANIQNGDNIIDFIVARSGNQQLTCSDQFQHINCGASVQFQILNINVDLQMIEGRISGTLFTGDIEEENTTIADNVLITFRGFY